MQVVKAKMQDGIFIPLTSVDFEDEGEMEAIIIISKKETIKKDKTIIESQSKAKEYFKANFPDLGIDESILDLVGAISESSTGKDKEEYYEYLERKYK